MESWFDRAVAAHESGRLEEAEGLYRDLLRESPEDAVVHELLGQVMISGGRGKEAVEVLRRATMLDAGSWSAWLALSVALTESELLGEAREACERSLALEGGASAARVQRAVIAARGGERDRASAALGELVGEPSLEPASLRLLADAARRIDRTDLLMGVLERLPDLADEECGELHQLALRCLAWDRPHEAERLLDLAHRRRPSHAGIAVDLASLLQRAQRIGEAVAVLERSVAANPSAVETVLTLLVIRSRTGREDGLTSLLATARSSGVPSWPLLLGQASCRLRACYADESDLQRSRAEVERDLRDAEESLDVSDRQRALEALDALQRLTFFPLPALGLDVRGPSEALGRMMTRVVGAIMPEAVSEAPSPGRGRSARIRVGVLSGYFRMHSNWKTHLSWLALLDRSRFEVTAYSTRPASGREREEARRRYERFVELGGDPIAMIQWLREQRLDAIVIPEVGMDPITRVVAAARLAPVQFDSWGHAVTSGYPSFTGFLSAALMELPEADAHYSEPLVRLPGVGGSFEPPPDAPARVTRAALGASDREVAIWCAHAPFTHLPQHDSLYVRIAQACPDARFIFLSPPQEPAFRRRLEQAFERHGLAPSTFLRFHPRMTPSQFLGANAACDFYLDTPEWSGCNTGLETILMGCPPITTPGRFMRGRHLWAFLQQMEMTDLAAESIDAYVDLAVDLVRSPDRRQEARSRLAERRHVLFGDPSPRIALERLIQESASTG